MPPVDVYFSVAKIFCPICGSRKFKIEKKRNLVVDVMCRGKKQYVYLPELLKYVWMDVACKWKVEMSKGDVVRAAIQKSDEEARRRINTQIRNDAIDGKRTWAERQEKAKLKIREAVGDDEIV